MTEALAELLKINAIRRIFTLVEVKRSEIVNLVGLASAIALLEGVGLSLLLPVLQYAQGGPSALKSGGAIWRVLQQFAALVHIPLTLLTLLALAFIPILFRQGVFYWNAWYSALVSNRIATRMRVSTFASMMKADPVFFEERPIGELAGLVLGQTKVAGDTVLLVIKLLAIGLLIALYFVILLFISVPLTLVTMVFAGAVALLVKMSVQRTRIFGERVAEITQQAFSAVVERLGLIRLVKMRAEEDDEIETITQYSEGMARANVQIAQLAAVVEITSDPLLMLSAFTTLYLGITAFGLKLAELGMLLFVLTRLNQKVKEFNNARQQISSGVGAIALVREIASDAEKANTIRGGGTPFTGVHQAITFEDTVYEYPNTDSRALQGATATIAAGSLTAIVGRSGAGKSTLVELLPRLRDATSGGVRYDGVDVHDFDIATLRRGIGYLTQEPLLLNETVRNNLTYGLRREASDAELIDALHRAYAQFVLEMPDGLDSIIGDRGLRVSGGERQRIALARVLLEDPNVLILDEPTSALDSETEQHIQAALSKLHGTKTIIVIAHRLATVVAADQLLVMDEGRVIERGTHGELVAAGGAYQRLFESQLLDVG